MTVSSNTSAVISASYAGTSKTVERRMEERGFTEVELRSMLQRARGYSPSVVEHRFMIVTAYESQR